VYTNNFGLGAIDSAFTDDDTMTRLSGGRDACIIWTRCWIHDYATADLITRQHDMIRLSDDKNACMIYGSVVGFDDHETADLIMRQHDLRRLYGGRNASML
jgi:hypothetical protein